MNVPSTPPPNAGVSPPAVPSEESVTAFDKIMASVASLANLDISLSITQALDLDFSGERSDDATNAPEPAPTTEAMESKSQQAPTTTEPQQEPHQPADGKTSANESLATPKILDESEACPAEDELAPEEEKKGEGSDQPDDGKAMQSALHDALNGEGEDDEVHSPATGVKLNVGEEGAQMIESEPHEDALSPPEGGQFDVEVEEEGKHDAHSDTQELDHEGEVDELDSDLAALDVHKGTGGLARTFFDASGEVPVIEVNIEKELAFKSVASKVADLVCKLQQAKESNKLMTEWIEAQVDEEEISRQQ